MSGVQLDGVAPCEEQEHTGIFLQTLEKVLLHSVETKIALSMHSMPLNSPRKVILFVHWCFEFTGLIAR